MGNVIQLGPTLGERGRVEVLDRSRTAFGRGGPALEAISRWAAPQPTGQCEFCEFALHRGRRTRAHLRLFGHRRRAGRAGRLLLDLRNLLRDWRDHYCWTALDTRGRAARLPDLFDSMSDLSDWPADVDAGERRRPTLAIAGPDESFIEVPPPSIPR